MIELRMEQIALPPNVPAGMNFLKLGHMTYVMRATTEHFDPIEVSEIGDGFYRITDGRHRFISALIAGRPSIQAIVAS
jgi:hypothetical protein